ncbi:MAG: SpaA isopeptide-forming pilin-related protein [Dysosmobacter sp.]|uniref:SpaA isopeptide-forming pilin-related protein n=1 Tax=Dysosmobacter sp. TaxID=2591382 RepID=UPI0028449D54|nr:SpaA isopeptide-forming pilin-related protein [Dysosmobacter sp.]MDR3982260.1 SpaA isopeptide-forming pilin-related protein [Dysosmobacter sp.]
MKKIRTRFLSAFLALLTLLTLLPTSALAASGSGTGIKPTTDPNLWSTRLTSTGQQYSYRPPTAAGKQLYCMDLGYSYRFGTASFLNSYTYKSATGTDSDTLWDSAVADTGLGEMDAITRENVKWMMTYITDYKGDIPGSLFMALQTYIWDHQSNKSAGGDTSGDIDAGGYANADTYETYLGYVNWLLAQKAKEDAEYQQQIEDYAAKGIIASVVEDENAKWAVYAKSSVKGRQSFFNYYAPRKLQVGKTPAPEEPDHPPAGDADITLKKVAAGTTRGLDGARFLIYRDGQIVGSDVTANGGIIEVNDVTKGLWSFVETEAPAGYCTDPTPISVYVDTTDGDKQYTVTAENYELPNMKIIKRDAMSGKPIAGTVFSIKSVTGSYSTSVTTGVDGSATLPSIPADVYVVREESVPEPYIVSNTEQTVALRPGKTSEVTFVDYVKPGLEILKKNIANGEPIEGVTFRIEQIDGSFSTSATTDGAGRIFLASIPVGSYRVTEKNVPSHVILSEIPQEIHLEAGCTRTVTFFNAVKPSLTILKRNSVTGDPLSNAKFHIYYGSDNTTTGEINDLGVFTTASDGKITLTDVNRGWYKLVEESAPNGFGIQGSGVTEFYLEANTSKTVTVDNVPHSALVVYKYDAKTGKGLEGCRFELRYLSGNTSGTGGTVIGTYVTSPNGAFTVTNLKKGTYVCQELESDGNHIIDREPQTVWISGEDQDVVTLRFGNAPLGSLLITKLSDDNKHEPLSGVEFLLTDSSGNYLGNDNGRFATNAAGEILVDGLEPGMTVIAREVRAKTGYLLDDSPQHALIKSGETAHLQFLNQPAGNLIIRKVSSGPNGEPLEGVEFKITYADGSFVPDANGELSSNGIYYTNKSGEIRISGVVGTVVATETKTIPGFTIDEATRTQTVVVNPNDTQTLTFYNKPTTTLILQKYISGTKNEPLAGVQFLVTDSSGAVVGPNNGYYTTDAAGQIVIEGLTDGMTVTAKEVKSVDGFVLDGTPQSIKIDQSQSPQRMTFWNERQGALIINKLSSLDRKTPLKGVTFKITTATGEFVPDENGKISSNGLYYTDENGQIILKGVTGTLVVTEVETIPGYTIEENTRTQTVVINPNDTQTLHFYNDPVGGVEIIKVNEDNHSERIPNTTFEIRKVDDALVDTVTTDKNGRVFVALEDGSYYAKEVTSNKSFRLDDTPHYFEIKDGKRVTLQVTNKKLSGIVIHKIDSATGEGIYGVKFVLYDANKKPIGEYTSDDRGYIYIDEIPGGLSGRFYLRELEAALGYTLDKQYKTVYVSPGKTVEIEWENTAVTGQIQIYKYAAEYNEVTGTVPGTPLKGAVYEIVNARSGKVVDYITTDARGVAASKPLPLTRYQLREVTAPAYWQLDPTVHDVTLEYPGQIIKLSAYDKPSSLGVSITKRGNAQVMAGQSMRYDLTVANTSNVPLESFFWHDKIPYDVARPTTLITGTYNARLNYRILYKTNYNASYQVLASNLLTGNNYSFALNAIPMQVGEVVTDIYFDFGKVPVGFQSTANPTLSVMVNGNTVNGYQMVNRADVGGKYQGTWQTATASWVTIIRRLWNTPTLPKTGY